MEQYFENKLILVDDKYGQMRWRVEAMRVQVATGNGQSIHKGKRTVQGSNDNQNGKMQLQ